MSHRTTFLSVVLLLAPIAATAGCANNTVGGGGGDPPPGVEDARLEIIGSPNLMLNEFGEQDLRVRYVDQDGQAIPSSIVDFAIEGTGRGAALGANSAQTDADGIATVRLRAGGVGSFDVVAEAPLADPAVWMVDVAQMRFGTLTYTVAYGGMRPVAEAETALFTNTTCSSLRERPPAPREVQNPRIGERSQFSDLEVGLPAAIYALGIDSRDQVAAEACADVMLTSPTGHVDIEVVDVRDLFGGEYETIETFDVTMGLPGALDTILEIFHGLGEDPAEFLVDFVAEMDGVPSWVRSALTFAPSRAIVIALMRDVLEDISIPGWVDAIFDLGGDFDHALTAMTLVGTLSFPEPDEFGAGAGTHTIRAMRVPVGHGGEIAERPLRAEADLPIMVGPTITLPEHALMVPFGRLFDILLREVLLPRLPGSPATIGDVISRTFDCRAIASRLAGDSSITADVVNAACELGAVFLGAYVEEELMSLFEYDVLNLSGMGNLTDSDMDYDRDRIEMGTAQARWTGPDGELRFPGTFTGSRIDDRLGRPHPIREVMSSLR